MRLYLVRHGKAEKESPSGRDDDRALRARGVRQAEWLGDRLSALPAARRPDLILSSPIVRAIDTARILQRALRAALEVEPALSTSSHQRAVLDLIRARGTLRTLVLVGHNPTFEQVAGALLGARFGHAPRLRTGEALVIDVDAAEARAGALVESLRFDDDDDDH